MINSIFHVINVKLLHRVLIGLIIVHG